MYAEFRVTTTVPPGFMDSGTRECSVFLRFEYKRGYTFKASEAAIRRYFLDTEATVNKVSALVHEHDKAPAGCYDHVADERGKYLPPDKR